MKGAYFRKNTVLYILQLRIYAGKTGLLQDSGNTKLVGFSLLQNDVSGQRFRDMSFIPFYLVYVISSLVLYMICVTTALFIASKFDSRASMKTFTDKNNDVLIGLAVVMCTFILLEVITEFIMAIIWAVAVKDPVITVYVLLSTVLYSIPCIVSVCNMVKHYFGKSGQNTTAERDTEQQTVSETTEQQTVSVTTEQQTVSETTEQQTVSETTEQQTGSEKSIATLPLYSFVWLASYFAYILLYAFFPAFILAFAYPVRVISIYIFMATFMVLFVLSVITYLKREVNFLPLKKPENNSKLHSRIKVFVGCFIALNFLYFFLFIFGLLYSLIIGKASVVSSAPLALLSLLPSILISAMAWIIKRTILDDNENENNEQLNNGKNRNEGNGSIDNESNDNESSEHDNNDRNEGTNDNERNEGRQEVIEITIPTEMNSVTN